MNIRPSRLRGGFLEIAERLYHGYFPCSLFSNSVARRPRRNDIEAIGKGIQRHGCVEVDGRHQPAGRLPIRDHAEHGIVRQERVTLEIHLRDEALREADAE